MTYVSEVRVFDPEYEANKLLTNTFALNRVLNECCVIALAVQFGSINSLMRYTWNVPGLCDIHQRDQTIDLYHECVLSLPDMTETSYNKCFNGLVAMFTAEKAAQITAFWNLGAAARKIVWSRATSPGNLYYVREYLLAAAAPTACDINKHRQGPTGRKKCMDDASLNNDDAEGMFAHQSKAVLDGKGGTQRVRGVALIKAPRTFDLAADIKKKRRRRFKEEVTNNKKMMEGWVENHRDDEGFLNLFNEKQTSVSARHQIIWDALRGRKASSARLRTLRSVRDKQKLERMVESNRTLQSRHENRLKDFYALKEKHRVCTVEELMSKLTEFDVDSGKEYSYAVKCDIVREQIQIRKRLDRVTKIGDVKLTNHSQKGIENPLDKLIEDFALIVQFEITNGIPIPKPPALLQPRYDRPGWV